MSDLRKSFSEAVVAAERRSWTVGRLGRINADASVTFAVPDKPGFVYVRVDGTRELTVAYNPGTVPLRANLAVKMRLEKGAMTLGGVYTGEGDTAGGNSFGLTVHHHRIGSGLEYVHDALLQERGRLYSEGGMTVTVSAFRYRYAGTWKTWPGGSLDLTSSKPATVGHWGWVLVGVNPATNALVATPGTSVIYATALEYDGLDAIAFTGIPVGAVRVRNDDTVLTDIARYVDAHEWYGFGVTTFVALTDTPSVYTGQGGKSLRVKAGATAVEFVAPYAHPNHSGDVTSVADGATTIAANVVTLAKMQQVATQTLLGRNTAATGNVEILSALPTDIDALYARLAGRAGGQSLRGGSAASETLTLESTAHATKGAVVINPTGGNVGIGTDATVGRLSVKQSSADISGGLVLFDTTGGSGSGFFREDGATGALVARSQSINTLFIKSGYVGIGVAAPGAALEIASNDRADSLRLKGYGTDQPGIMLERAAGDKWNIFNRATGDGLAFYEETSGSVGYRFFLQEGGRVGIGTTAPTGQAHIDQASSVATIPVLLLDQGSSGEDFIEFIGASGATTGTPVSTGILGGYAGKLKITVNSTVYWIPFHS